MAQIKDTVELLTRILRQNGLSKIKSEVFRQSKFDKDEATGSMWRLLFEIIYYLKYRKVEDITLRAYSELTDGEICIYVKTEMKMRGFVSRSFHELPNDMSTGARELLLAFGWLMCRSGLIDLFMEQCCTFLEEPTPEMKGYKKPQRTRGVSENMELQDKVNYLMWLNNKLRMSLRNVHTLQQNRDALTEQVHRYTQGVTTDQSQRDHLTVLEVMMLKNPDLLKKNLKLLESDNRRLESLIAWQQHDDIFWKWMESVLDAKIADCGLIDEIDDTITPRTQATKLQLDNKLKLAESVNKYDSIVSQLEHDVLSKKENGETTMADIDKVLSDINTEIKSNLDVLLKRTVEYTKQTVQGGGDESDSMVPDFSPYTPVARIKPLRREESIASTATSATAAEMEINKMESELLKLQSLVERLQEDIEYKQTKYEDDLSSVTSGLEFLYDHINRGPVGFNM